jgi:hypothetical protein
MKFDPEVWGPHYWFFLNTLAHSYPENANSVTKRKYYDFITNLPLFIPDSAMGDQFARLLDKYPVSPYLDSRESFLHWVHFIHNKVNVLLGKEEISYLASLEKYRANYKHKKIVLSERWRLNKKYVHFAIILSCLFLIYYWMDK